MKRIVKKSAINKGRDYFNVIDICNTNTVNQPQ